MNIQTLDSSDRLAGQLAALAHPARLRILLHLSSKPACCCKEVVDCLDLAQSTVSQHLKILVDAGLVRFTPERPRSRYQVERSALSRLSADISGVIDNCCARHDAHTVQDEFIGK